MTKDKMNHAFWISSFITDLERALKSEARTTMNMEEQLNEMIGKAKDELKKITDELEKDELRELLASGYLRPDDLGSTAFLRTRFFEKGYSW